MLRVVVEPVELAGVVSTGHSIGGIQGNRVGRLFGALHGEGGLAHVGRQAAGVGVCLTQVDVHGCSGAEHALRLHDERDVESAV
ncbi:hypothetical protein SDC9_154559 [bioreactor metagenome]|uniref:Uncharacterized protein n=1 Tax=bioreactor metagenome TaxID=1076179 RepID=A0A645F401_9ZZZZ